MFWGFFLIPVKKDCYGIGGFGQCLSPPALAEKPNPPRLCPKNHFPSLLFFDGETEAAGRISPVLGCPGHLRAQGWFPERLWGEFWAVNPNPGAAAMELLLGDLWELQVQRGHERR